MVEVNEAIAWHSDANEKELMEIQFLHNVGELYRQTRLPIKDIRRMKTREGKFAVIICDNDYEYQVDITGDSWSAMITDIARFVSIKF